MGFAEELRRAAAPILEAILEHPYLNELASGTLPREIFRFYVQQDWLYLQEFTRTAAMTAARCPDVKEMRLLLTWGGASGDHGVPFPPQSCRRTRLGFR